MTVTFLVTGLSIAGVTQGLAGPPPADTSAVKWTDNHDGTWTVSATVPAGQSSVTVSADAALHDRPGVIDAESIRFEVTGINTNGLPLVADGQHIVQGTPIDFTVVDADYAAVHGQHGINGHDVVGMELHTMDHTATLYDASDENTGRIVVAADGQDNTIYGSSGNDILVGGSGNDIFAWNNDNMNGTDTVKNFELGKDHLQFDDIFGSANNGGMADLGNLLHADNAANQSFTQAEDGSAKIFTVGDGHGGVDLTLTVSQAMASLNVHYTDASGEHSQTVNIDFAAGNVPDFANMDADAASQMIQDIIKTGGGM
jgi:Ca2+-binding RTX toxin-like protein